MKLGRLEKIDLRTYWSHEATEFTPWLAQEENIRLLSETIGIDLEVQSSEVRVGPFSADILCKDTLNDQFVLIENQLEKTDHTHLGQLMTYAAGLDAVTIIWIAKTFTEEHRAALDWLNRITDETFTFFGIEIELYKIGESSPAPMFNIVSKPNDWTKQVKHSTTAGAASETQLLQQEYWKGLKDFMEKNRSFIKMQSPPLKHWTSISLGRSNFHLSASLNSSDNSISIWLVMTGGRAKQNYDKLHEIAYQNSLSEINKDLVWDEMEGRKRSSVVLKISADFTDKKDWENQFEWFRVNLEKFMNYFKPHITKL